MHSARSQSRARYEADGGNLIEQKFIISCNQVMTCTNGPHLGRDAKLAEKEARRRKSKKSNFFYPMMTRIHCSGKKGLVLVRVSNVSWCIRIVSYNGYSNMIKRVSYLGDDGILTGFSRQ